MDWKLSLNKQHVNWWIVILIQWLILFGIALVVGWLRNITPRMDEFIITVTLPLWPLGAWIVISLIGVAIKSRLAVGLDRSSLDLRPEDRSDLSVRDRR